jgi:hypothetical protein
VIKSHEGALINGILLYERGPREMTHPFSKKMVIHELRFDICWHLDLDFPPLYKK